MVQVTGLKGKINMQVTEISINGHPATSQELYLGQKIWKRKKGWEAEKKEGNREEMKVDIGGNGSSGPVQQHLGAFIEGNQLLAGVDANVATIIRSAGPAFQQNPVQYVANSPAFPHIPPRFANMPPQLLIQPSFPSSKPVIQQIQSNFLPISRLNDVFSCQMNPSLARLQRQLLSKYPGVYWSQGNAKGTGSIAAYLFQSLLFERVLVLENKPNSVFLLSNSLSFSLERLPNADISLLKPDFEGKYREEIAYIDSQLPQLTNSDLQPLCSLLKVCLVVFKPTNSNDFKVQRLYPADCDRKLHKIALIAKPPFPVLIPHKVLSILSYPIGICLTSPFVITQQKREPPPFDPILSQKVQKCREFSSEGEKLLQTLLLFAGKIVARFNFMLGNREFGEDLCSGEIGKGLHSCWELVAALLNQDFQQLWGYAKDCIGVIKAPLAHFTQKCELCSGQYRQFVLDCKHSICEICMNGLINRAFEQKVTITVNLPATGLKCPICQREILSSKLQKQDKNLYNRLLDQLASEEYCKICDQCQKVRPNALIFKNCMHTCCYFCAKNSIITCRKCQIAIYLPTKMDQIVINCQCCLERCCVSSLVPAMCAKVHAICKKCAYSAIIRRKCPVQNCEIAYLESQMQVLETLAEVKCINCSEIRPYSEILKTNCSCVICFTCVKAFQPSANCWFCGTIFPNKLCFICKNAGELMNLMCGDCIHRDCLEGYVANRCANEPIGRVDCKDCGVELFSREIYQLIANIPQGYMSENPKKWREVSCPACLSPVMCMKEDSSVVEQFPCPCGFTGCALCLNQWDDFHFQGLCMMKTAPEKLLELAKSKKSGVMCPYCRSVQERRQGWQHCEIATCAQVFCSDCGVLKNTVEKHGPGYHRPDCSQYSGQVFSTEFVHDCIRCKHIGDAGCQALQRLPRKGYIHAGLSYYR
jgi:hypothetical protein